MKTITHCILLAIVFIGCCHDSKGQNGGGNNSINHTSWKLDYIEHQGRMEYPATNYFLTVNTDSTFTLNLSVNRTFGRYKIENTDRLSFQTPFAVTKICCDNEYDELLISVVSGVSTYSQLGDKLILDGDGTLQFSKD